MRMMRPDPKGTYAIRVSHYKERQIDKHTTMQPRYLFRCGCCNGKDFQVEIYYDEYAGKICSLEINGIQGSTENWREILLPLLGVEKRNGRFVNMFAAKER